MEKWQKRLETAINLSILCAFLMVAALAGKRLFQRSTNDAVPEPKLGATVSLPGMDWSKSDENVVLFLSVSCHFCSESAVFYRRLVPAAASKHIPVVAVLPQSEKDGRNYLELLRVPAPAVIQGELTSVNVSGTPTVLILDHQGKLKKAWVGKLHPDGEQQVLESLEPQGLHP